MSFADATSIRDWRDVDRRLFDEEIRPLNQPAVLRGVAADWPAVQSARRSDEQLVGYLKQFDTGRRVMAIVGQPDIGGRFFYTDDLSALNFERGTSALGPFLDRLLRDRDQEKPLAMAVQSELISEALPGLEKQNRLDLVAPEVVPLAWIGNRVRVAPHYDAYENVGVVVAGRRRFTLFPPDQVANLYVGPFELTPAGTPISLVDLEKPDLRKFPRFVAAMKSAQSAVLEPGDGIYIPFHWWHAVDSLEPFNLFVNYWWNEARSDIGQPYDALMHAFYALKPLPHDQRAAWRALFDHYVFCMNGDPAEHLPAHARGVLGEPQPQLLARMRGTLKQILQRL